MAFNTPNILLIMAGAWAVGQLIQALKLRSLAGAGWRVVAFLVLAAIAGGLWAFPRHAGYISAGLVLVFGIVPQVGMMRLSRMMSHGRYQSARRLAWLVAMLHPADGYPVILRVASALHWAQAGDFAPAERLLKILKGQNTPAAINGSYMLFRALGQYEEVAAWIDEKMKGLALAEKPQLALFRIRALAETGQVAEAFALYRRFRAELPQKIYELFRYHGGDLFLAAFTGRVAHTEKLLGPISQSGTGLHGFWMATARMNDGQPVEEELTRLRDSNSDPLLRRAIEHRLAQARSWQALPALAAEDEALLGQLELDWDQTRRYAVGPEKAGKPYVTYALVLMIAIMFAVELASGGATNLATLWRLGAMDGKAFVAGAWWRLLAHGFLHYGWPHLILNLLALLYFGPFVERSLGPWRYLLCYFVSGMGAALTDGLSKMNSAAGPMMLVGASGAIMGIISATGAVLLRGWIKESAAFARRRLKSIALIIGIQVIFDQLFPQIGAMVHFYGFVIGFFITFILQEVFRRPSSRNS